MSLLRREEKKPAQPPAAAPTTAPPPAKPLTLLDRLKLIREQKEAHFAQLYNELNDLDAHIACLDRLSKLDTHLDERLKQLKPYL